MFPWASWARGGEHSLVTGVWGGRVPRDWALNLQDWPPTPGRRVRQSDLCDAQLVSAETGEFLGRAGKQAQVI